MGVLRVSPTLLDRTTRTAQGGVTRKEVPKESNNTTTRKSSGVEIRRMVKFFVHTLFPSRSQRCTFDANLTVSKLKTMIPKQQQDSRSDFKKVEESLFRRHKINLQTNQPTKSPLPAICDVVNKKKVG